MIDEYVGCLDSSSMGFLHKNVCNLVDVFNGEEQDVMRGLSFKQFQKGEEGYGD